VLLCLVADEKERLVLQKWFSAFPGRWPGLGLLLLRVLVAVSVIVQTIAYAVATTLSVTGWLVAALILAGAVCLLLGFVTPVAAALIGLASLGLTFSTVSYSIQNLDIAVLAVVVALLGPGAFSIDARMFGHREILIPRQR
jgi:uncharacterized membrane protein YphA (DoxX/SURF4 family)